MTHIQQARLKALIKLSSSVRVYVPGTINTDQDYDNTADVNNTAARLSEYFGGATVYNALGCWVSPVHGLIREHVTIVESHCNTASLDAHIDDVLNLVTELKSRLAQEALAIEVNHNLYFV